MILGLDISTSITGYAIVDLKGKAMEVGSWDMRNKRHFPDIFSKSLFIKEKLKEIDYPIDHIFIEPALNMSDCLIGLSGPYERALTLLRSEQSWSH